MQAEAKKTARSVRELTEAQITDQLQALCHTLQVEPFTLRFSDYAPPARGDKLRRIIRDTDAVTNSSAIV